MLHSDSSYFIATNTEYKENEMWKSVAMQKFAVGMI